MTGQSPHKERTRARILDEAAKAMRVHGHEGIGVAELMKRAGLTHGGFYAHFSSRDDLVAHAIDRMFQDSARMLHRFLGEDATGESLAALIDYYLSEAALRTVDRGCPLPGLSGEAGRMPVAARERFQAGMNSFRQAIGGVLVKLGKPDPYGLAASVLAEMVGAMAMARALSDEAAALDLLGATRHNLKQRLGLATDHGTLSA